MCDSNSQYCDKSDISDAHNLKQPYTLFFEWLCAKIWTQSFGTFCSFINSRLI